MRRLGHVILVLVLLSLMAAPSMGPPQGAANNPVLGAVTLAADGDLSTDSITSFSETTADDVLFYPDLFTLDVTETPDNGYADGSESGTWTNTQTKDATTWDISAGDAYLEVLARADVEGFAYSLYAKEHAAGNAIEFAVYDWDDSAYDTLVTIAGTSLGWHNGTANTAGYVNSTNYLKFRFDITVTEAVYIDYLEIDEWHILTMMDSDHYAESFADVSDWTEHSLEAGDTFTTDGDVASLEADGSWDHAYTDDPSADGYLEVRFKTNKTSGVDIKIYLYDTDGRGSGNTQIISLTESTSWTTTKVLVTLSVVECVELIHVAGSNVKTEFDYLQIGPADEMGWQHDGSTTEGVDVGGGCAISSDADLLNITNDAGSQAAEYCEILFDTTTTKGAGSFSYYPFIEWSISEVHDDVSDGYVWLTRLYDSAGAFENIAGYSADTGVFRYNLAAATPTDFYKMRIYVHRPNDWFTLDYMQLFGIANWTYSHDNELGTDEYAYVDSSELVIHIDNDASDKIHLGHDPAVSIAGATYNVVNVTGHDVNNWNSMYGHYYSGGWSAYEYGSRHTHGFSTTITDFEFLFYRSGTISAIKFWEDATAPTMSDKWVNPPEPYDDESTTITVAATDSVDIYTVKLNAETFPTGFSDVDYTMTESVDNALYKYTFSGMTAGYYEFAINVNDGANTYTEYIPLTVRESEISVNSISLFGAGDDFDYMHWSFKINKDCSYVIREWSENVGASDTYSGNVAEGVRNIAWEKLPTDDTKVNFTVTFTNASLTYVFDSSYEVAQTALAITGDESISQDEIVYSGTSTKACSWTLYLDSVQEDTGSIAAAGSFVVNWTRTQSIDPSSISYAIKFYTATETVWENGTYSEYSLTAFSIQTLFMDLTDPSISAIFTTSWGNTTGYLYEADVQKATGAEGTTLSYTKSTTAGTYNVALKIDAGGEIAWYNTTYTVAVTTLQVTDDSIRTTASYAYLSGHVNLNANYIVYEETVQVGTGSVTAGSFEIRWTKAFSSVENVTVLFESGSQSYPVYSGYDVAAQVTFVVESWWMDLNLGVESYVEFYVLSSFENATVYVYDNNTLMTTVTESAGGAYSYFWMSESEGLHTITLNITHGATVHTRTRTYYIPDWAATGLVVRWDLWTFQDNYTMLELGSNWMNCTYYIYLNSSLVATSANDPVTLNFTRAINIGEYNLTIYADAGAQTYTIKNIRYIITEEGVSYDYSSVVGGRSVREGDIYEGDVYEGDTHENPPGIYMTAETAATIAVSTVFIFFLAVLFMNSRVKKAQLDRDKKGNQ